MLQKRDIVEESQLFLGKQLFKIFKGAMRPCHNYVCGFKHVGLQEKHVGLCGNPLNTCLPQVPDAYFSPKHVAAIDILLRWSKD